MDLEKAMLPQRLAQEHWREGDKTNPYSRLSKVWLEYEDEWMKLEFIEEVGI